MYFCAPGEVVRSQQDVLSPQAVLGKSHAHLQVSTNTSLLTIHGDREQGYDQKQIIFFVWVYNSGWPWPSIALQSRIVALKYKGYPGVESEE